VIRVLLGPKWTQVVVPFQIFAVGMLFRTSYKMSDSITRATGAVYRRAWRQGIYAVLVIGGALMGSQWGLPGVSALVLAAIAVNFFLMAQLSLELAGMTWGSFWAAHTPALALTVILGSGVWVIATVLRDLNLSAILVLLVAGGFMLSTTLLLLRYTPEFVLGQDGLWMLRKLASYLPSRVNPFNPLRRGI